MFRPGIVLLSVLAGVGMPASAPALQDADADSLQALATFDTVWTRIRDTHYDPGMGGLDWEQVRDELRPRAGGATSREELRGVIRQMLDRLDESHFVLLPGRPPPGEAGAGTVGMEVRWIPPHALVTRVEPGSPADAEGVRPGMHLLSLGGRPAAELVGELTAGFVGEEAKRAPPRHLASAGLTRLLGGPVGSELELVLRRGGEDPVRVVLSPVEPTGEVLRFGNLPPLRLRMEACPMPLRNGGVAGVIHFSGWFPAAAPPIAEAVDRFRDHDGIVIDLRGNPGGIGGLVMGIGGHFLDTPEELGTMRTRDASIRFVVNPQRVGPDGRRVVPFAGPLAILVDPLSGSTSEIFAAGMQALGRARIFGERTAGEALPAAVMRLPNGDRLMHAIADFTAPDGSRLEGRGVVPDEIVVPDGQSLLAGEDPVLLRALEWIAAASDRKEETLR